MASRTRCRTWILPDCRGRRNCKQGGALGLADACRCGTYNNKVSQSSSPGVSVARTPGSLLRDSELETVRPRAGASLRQGVTSTFSMSRSCRLTWETSRVSRFRLRSARGDRERSVERTGSVRGRCYCVVVFAPTSELKKCFRRAANIPRQQRHSFDPLPPPVHATGPGQAMRNRVCSSLIQDARYRFARPASPAL